ncbi:group II intron maturase-specific domain-containing protein [Spirillospora sp. NPDC048819]|uniref:group II intron maturase-specific domain-containing protein n=1 Tax=Spirillospora sp. NPDC048819 TaxID=3155268 RepID=UPI0033EE582D
MKLKVNRAKSSVWHAREATLPGFGFDFTRSGVGIRVDPKAVERLKGRIRELTSLRWSVSMPCRIDKLNAFIRGWMACSSYRQARRAIAGLRQLPAGLGDGVQYCSHSSSVLIRQASPKLMLGAGHPLHAQELLAAALRDQKSMVHHVWMPPAGLHGGIGTASRHCVMLAGSRVFVSRGRGTGGGARRVRGRGGGRR